MRINELDSLSIFIDGDIAPTVGSPVSTLFNDTVVGYVVTLRETTSVLVGVGPYPYIIPGSIADKYFLSTGDKVCAAVSADGAGRRFVTDIIRVNRQDNIRANYTPHFDSMEGTPPTAHTAIRGQKVPLGTTVMITVKQSEMTNENVAQIISGCRAPNSETISLGIQAKPENLNYLLSHGCDYGYSTAMLQSLQQQLMVIVTAFFRAKELAERGKNVFLFCSNFEKLLRLFNEAITELNPRSARIAQNAERDLMCVIRQAKSLPNGGSLTVLGFQITDSGVDDPDLRRRISTMCDFVI